MMSPLAVAQYIPDTMTFDLVVIDEASQMTPEDALGAIRRGRQVMIVGDTNQLPPTTFFKKLLDQQDENEDDMVIEESVLDMANSAFRPKRRLRWHYRSQDSSLIQFSNEYVYDRSLVFFPSPTEGRPDMGVKFLKVDGIYASGTNPVEARSVVNHALQFMKRFPDRSLGIVTMNQKQQELIEAEMNEALSRDSKASDYVAHWSTHNDGLEYFFIKNLENVQGDERDAIFIGTVYGPPALGQKVAQRFGPINGVAGKRRLNVLFTRAKKLIVTFSSMNADDIREEGTNAGVSLFRKWIEYSATGMLRPDIDTGREADSDFELHVMEQLRSIGCEVVPQVGVEGYFIDIGVKHAQSPHGFILGVECDGATYHSSKSARDRDRLRQEVLEGLGWTLYRIWSTDWFNDAQSETAKLKTVIEARLKQLQDAIIEMPPDFLEKKAPVKPTEPTDVKYEMDGLPDIMTGVTHPKALFTAYDAGISVGDQVTVRYLDGSKAIRVFTLSDQRNDPVQGLVAVWEPLGDVLQGANVGEELEFEVAGQMRSVRIEKIEKASAAV
jgi:very-short-patch-repair endonuclease